jgi:hypothetical protein
MQYLVEMKLAASRRPSGGAEEGIACIEQLILPSLEACETLSVPTLPRNLMSGSAVCPSGREWKRPWSR